MQQQPHLLPISVPDPDLLLLNEYLGHNSRSGRAATGLSLQVHCAKGLLPSI
jgi:hypothetical protein